MTLTQTDPATAPVARSWVRVCAVSDLEVERGRAALIDDTQIALFLLPGGAIHAVSNLDPYSDAHVMSRGIVGTRRFVETGQDVESGQDTPTVASPMYKQVFDLRTGACLDTQGKDPRSLRVWPVSQQGDDVYIRWE